MKYIIFNTAFIIINIMRLRGTHLMVIIILLLPLDDMDHPLMVSQLEYEMQKSTYDSYATGNAYDPLNTTGSTVMNGAGTVMLNTTRSTLLDTPVQPSPQQQSDGGFLKFDPQSQCIQGKITTIELKKNNC